MQKLDPKTTALVLIDLQQGILRFPAEPHGAATVLAHGAALARRCRAAGALVVLVRVGWSADFGDAPRQTVDRPPPMPPGGLPADWLELPAALEHSPSDILIVKRQWGAFYGTELDLQLRRRGVRHVVLGGISTNIGVESTARAAWEHGYELILAEDAMGGGSADMHGFAVSHIFPRLGLVRSTAEILAALG